MHKKYMAGWFLLGAILFSFPVRAAATVLLSDNFSGVPGTPLLGRSLDVGGVWSNLRIDGLAMNGSFVFVEGGGVVDPNNAGSSIYTAFDASSAVDSLTNGFTLSTTFSANGYDGFSFTLGLAESINKGHFVNLSANDVIHLTYFSGGINAGRFKWGVYDESVRLNTSYSTRAGSETILSNDLIRLSITCYPAAGLVEGEAINLTGGYLLSKSRLAFNTPGLTNTLYAGLGMTQISVANPADPAVISSFSVISENLAAAARPFALAETLPPVMTAFAFDDFDVGGETNPLFQNILAEHAPIDMLHSVRHSVYETVRTTYPDKPITIQMAWGGTAGINLESIYPGHCLMKAGTKLTADCSATPADTVLYLEDHALIAASQAAIDNATPTAAYALLYALDANGRPDWSQVEQVSLISVNTSLGTVTVRRGQLGSSPLAFTSGQAAIARHMMFWSNQWQLNLSLESPRGGPFNMTAAEWFALRVTQEIHQTGADGVEFDVARWQWGYPVNNPMDCDNDRVADYGYIDGVNSFGLGGQVMLGKLRELLGSDRIIQMDGNDALFGQRGWKYVNGVQLESFPKANQFDRYSESFQHLRQWVGNISEGVSFSYPFTKTPTTLFGNAYDTDGSTVDWRFRVGFAAALLTGMPHPFASITDINFDPANPDANPPDLTEDKGFFKWDEYVGGGLNDWKWMGAPQGEALQTLGNMGGTDLLASTLWQWKTETDFSATCSVSNAEYTAIIHAIPSNTLPWVSAYYPGSQVPKALWFGSRLEIASGAPTLVSGQEYTLEFEAKGSDLWSVDGQVFEEVPRALIIHGVADYGYHDSASVFLEPEWTSYRFSMTAASNPKPLAFGFSEQVGDASIRNIRLYVGGAERWSREFAQGRVYLNMTAEPWIVAVGTGVAQRLNGTQIPELNNGAVVNGLLTIPSWDAVFLRTGTYEAWLSAQFVIEASDDFSTGFDERDLGDPLPGFTVQTGLGTWANAYTDGSRTMELGMAFVEGGGLTEALGAGGGVYVPFTEMAETFSMEIMVEPNDFSTGSFTLGFVETIDKGYFINMVSDDVLRMRYIHSGGNAGKFQFVVYDEGSVANADFSLRTGSQQVAASDKVRLSLSYNAASGAVTGTAYNVTGGYELSSKAITVMGLANMTNAGFGWAFIPNQATTPSANPGIVSAFRAGTSMDRLEESIRGESADPDGDGFSNHDEYIAGTDPLDADSQFYMSGGIGDGEVMLDWSSVSGRVYDVYWSTNLLHAFVPLKTDIEYPESTYTNLLPVEPGNGFYQIKVRKP